MQLSPRLGTATEKRPRGVQQLLLALSRSETSVSRSRKGLYGVQPADGATYHSQAGTELTTPTTRFGNVWREYEEAGQTEDRERGTWV
jgi:hypothetical protein